MRKILAAAAVTAVALVIPSPAGAARSYSNCKALNKDYPHGVGRSGARDSTSGRPVTNFKRNAGLYNANKSRDRDKDGIACEKR